jgi:guanosine-3',5'-bis(diphosphate) 3'-pyrophosphohydrolase
MLEIVDRTGKVMRDIGLGGHMLVWGNELVMEAQAFVEEAYEGRYRKGATKKPQVEHFIEVAQLVSEYGGDPVEVAAALLHDVPETLDEDPASIPKVVEIIKGRFGNVVAEIVEELTDPPEYKMLSSIEKKRRQKERLLASSESSQRIKVADLVSNLKEIVANPPEGWTHEKCLGYVRGSFSVASACMGAAGPFLMSKFLEAYTAAFEKYKG